jgi:hypothetical protein
MGHDTCRPFFIATPMFLFGVQHFIYLSFVANFIPAWIPWHYFWACFTGLGFNCSSLRNNAETLGSPGGDAAGHDDLSLGGTFAHVADFGFPKRLRRMARDFPGSHDEWLCFRPGRKFESRCG